MKNLAAIIVIFLLAACGLIFASQAGADEWGNPSLSNDGHYKELNRYVGELRARRNTKASASTRNHYWSALGNRKNRALGSMVDRSKHRESVARDRNRDDLNDIKNSLQNDYNRDKDDINEEYSRTEVEVKRNYQSQLEAAQYTYEDIIRNIDLNLEQTIDAIKSYDQQNQAQNGNNGSVNNNDNRGTGRKRNANKKPIIVTRKGKTKLQRKCRAWRKVSRRQAHRFGKRSRVARRSVRRTRRWCGANRRAVVKRKAQASLAQQQIRPLLSRESEKEIEAAKKEAQIEKDAALRDFNQHKKELDSALEEQMYYAKQSRDDQLDSIKYQYDRNVKAATKEADDEWNEINQELGRIYNYETNEVNKLYNQGANYIRQMPNR